VCSRAIIKDIRQGVPHVQAKPTKVHPLVWTHYLLNGHAQRGVGFVGPLLCNHRSLRPGA
jgi:hypothetical protein